MAIDILQARQNIEPLVQGLVTGTGISMGTKEIILYVPDNSKAQEIRNRIGESYQGFKLKFVVSGGVVVFQ